MAVKSSLAHALQKCLGNQWTQNNFIDFTVKVEDSSFQCHKVILGACSDYFQALFRSNMKESQENCVELNGMTKDIFSLIHVALYKGIDVLTEDNIFKVWSAVVQLQIQYLIAECENFVINKMSLEKCFVYYDHALLYSSREVISAFFKFMCTCFESVKSTDGFLKLPASDIYTVISSNKLKASSEDSVVDHILEWLEYIPPDATNLAEPQAENRKHHIVKLLSAVRLCLVSPACLLKLTKYDLVLSCTEAHDMVIEAVNYNWRVEARHDMWPETAVHRATSTENHAMVFVDNDKLMAYKLNKGILHQLSKLPNSTMASITVFDNVLYLCTPSALSMYSHEHEWVNVIENGSSSGVSNILLSHGSYIYCIVSLRWLVLKRYNCTHGHSRVWKECKTLDGSVDSMVRFKEYILIFYLKDRTFTTRCFDTIRGSFIPISPENPMTGRSNGMVTLTDNNDVFILQGNGIMWKIISTNSSLIDFVYISNLWNFNLQIYGAVIYQKQLFVFVCKYSENISDIFQWPDSHRRIFETFKVVQIDSNTQCLPMVISR